MAPVASPARLSSGRVDLVTAAIVLLALAFRLYRIDVPFVDAHSWRQVTNADIARLWAEGPIDFFYPAVSWGGPDGRVGLEFPLLHLLMALVWRVVGVVDVAGRLVPVAFSVASVWLMARLGTRLFDQATGRAAAFLMAVSPSLVYFGRTPLSDTLMVTFSIAAVLGYVAYWRTGRWPHALAGAVGLALAGLVKLPAILVLGPVVWIGLVSRGKGVWRDPWYTAAPLAAMGAVGLWYLHADQIYLETGLTQAIFRPSGTYSPDIAQWAGPFTTVSHWTTKAQLTYATFSDLATRYVDLHLTPLFAVAAAVGLLTWRRRWQDRTVVDIWMLAGLSLVVVSLAGQVPHEFHQLPTLPPLALYAGLGAAPLFDGERYARLRGPLRLLASGMVAAVLVAVALWAFDRSGVIRNLYRPDYMNYAVMNAGEQLQQATPPAALVATIEYDRYGSNSPMLLYFAHRKGWSFDNTSISPSVVAYLRSSRGVCYLAATDWPLIERTRPDMVDFVKSFHTIDLPYAYGYRFFDLGCPPAAPR